jgi:hypothetical protein
MGTNLACKRNLRIKIHPMVFLVGFKLGYNRVGKIGKSVRNSVNCQKISSLTFPQYPSDKTSKTTLAYLALSSSLFPTSEELR